MDPPIGVVDGIWFLWPQLQCGLGSTGKGFRPGSSCMGGAALGILGGGSCKNSSGPGVSSNSSAKPSTKKRVRPGAKVGSSPRSSSRSNLTCFFGFSASVRASQHHTLLLDLWSHVYKFRSFIEWLSCLVTGWDHGGLEEGDWLLLGY